LCILLSMRAFLVPFYVFSSAYPSTIPFDTLSLHDALPILFIDRPLQRIVLLDANGAADGLVDRLRLTGAAEGLIASDWPQALSMATEPDTLVLLEQVFQPVPELCTGPVVNLARQPEGGVRPVAGADSHYRHASVAELLRCLRYARDRHEMLNALARAATDDPLTGCSNRQMLQDRLKHGMQRALRANQPLAVLVLDLDNFSHVNDSLGHAAGDAIIRQV